MDNPCYLIDAFKRSRSTLGRHMHRVPDVILVKVATRRQCSVLGRNCVSNLVGLLDTTCAIYSIPIVCSQKPEPVSILRASMRYLSLVLCAAERNLEFQRQVVIPIVPKVSLALLTIAEKHNDRDIKVVPHILTETRCSSFVRPCPYERWHNWYRCTLRYTKHSVRDYTRCVIKYSAVPCIQRRIASLMLP